MNLRNPKEYCENLLWIRTKKQTMARLRFNDAQNNLYGVIRRQAAQGKPVRLIVLKGRQEGISTVTEGLMFQDTVTRPNVKTLIVAHENTATANLFKMNKLFYDSLPPGAQPMRKKRSQLLRCYLILPHRNQRKECSLKYILLSQRLLYK